MGSRSIPEPVQRFILTSIRSVPHLEALLLLRDDPQPAWDPKDVARRLYTDPAIAKEVLNDLCSAGFTVSGEEPGQYRYSPSSDELRAMIDGLAEQYVTNLIALTELIHARGRMKEQQFADAFLLGKDKN